MNDLKQNPEKTTAFNGLIKKILSSKMSESEIEDYILKSGKLLDPIDATLDLNMLGFDGSLKCKPKDTNKYPYVWDHRIYGFGMIGIDNCKGSLGTGYADWSGLWENTTSAAIASAEFEFGVIMVMFFRKDGMPIGDFRGIPSGGIGIVGGGGEGGWNKL